MAELDLPITQKQSIEVRDWLLANFGGDIEAAIAGTPFDKFTICGIACVETAYIWVTGGDNAWTKKYPAQKIASSMILDASGDINHTRSAFPKNSQAFIDKYGQEFYNELVSAANETRAMRGYSPKSYLYNGFGLWQYDLQAILTDEIFWRDKQWQIVPECLKRLVGELQGKWKASGGNLKETIRRYNGSGQAAEDYAAKVMQYIQWIKQ